MSLAITEDHIALADTVSDFLVKHRSRALARELLDGADEALPEFWADLCALGWPGLHVPEEHGGSGYGLPELTVVVEEMGRGLAPGPFVPTVTASAVLVAAASPELAGRLLPGLARRGDRRGRRPGRRRRDPRRRGPRLGRGRARGRSGRRAAGAGPVTTWR